MKAKAVHAVAMGLCAFAMKAPAQDGATYGDLDSLLASDWAAETESQETPASQTAPAAGTSPEAAEVQDEGSSPSSDAEAEASAEVYSTIPASDPEPVEESAGRRPSASRLVEEIIVTAQKREEYLQDVPIMINAFSGEKLDAFGVENTADLQRITPGLSYTYTYGYSVIYMRGVGTDAFLPNADPSVATYIDGVNITPSQGKQDTIGPVERVEVLKGPQGTLFGRNATGGAINIVTADPPDEFLGSVKAEFGNYNSRKYQAYFGTPITSWLGATLALYKEDQDLYGRNEVYGEPGPMRNDYVEGGRLKLKMYATDNLSLTVTAALNEQFNSNSLSQENTRPAPIFDAGVEPDPNDPDRVWHNNYLGGNDTSNALYAATLEWLTDFADIKFIFSDNKADVDEAMMDYDSTETAQATFYSNDQYNYQRTYELQFVSNSASPFSNWLQWVGGLYRLEGEGGFGALYFTVNAAGFGSNVIGLPRVLNQIGSLLGASNLGYTVGQLINASNDVVLGNGGLLITESDAVYLQGTVSPTDWLDVTLGARYQVETRGLTNSYLDVVLPTAGSPPNDYFDRHDTSQNLRVRNFEAPDLEDKTLSPKLAIQIRPSDNIQYFASAQRAFKSPTYNIVNFFTNPDAVERETATAYEIGFKSDLLDGTLRLNAAAFYTQIDGLLTAIVSLGSGGIVTFRNAGEAEIKGVEFDMLWQPMPSFNPGLAISAGATWLRGVYTDYRDGVGYDDDTGLYFGDDSLYGGPARDFTGNDIVRTPDLTTNISLNQAISVGRGSFEIGIDYYYNSGFNTTPQNSPFYEQPAYDLWSGRLSWFYDPLGLQLTGFVDNALDEQYIQAMLQQDFGRTVTLAPPRTYGLRVKWSF
jgi:iron complex outermembrane receptor protein